MNLKQIILKNTSIQMFSQVITLGIGLFLTMMLSRHLGVEGFGQFNYVFAFFFFFFSLIDFGIDAIVVRESSREKEKAEEIFSSMLLYKLVVSIVFLAIAWLVIARIDYSQELKSALRLYSFVLPIMALNLPQAIFRVVLKMEYPCLLGILKTVTHFILILFCLQKGYGLQAILASYLVSEIVFMGSVFVTARKFVSIKFAWNAKVAKNILKSSIPLGISGLFIAILQRADFVMIERMRDASELGLYSAAYRVKNLLEMIPVMLMATVFPLMSRYVDKDFPLLVKIYRKCFLLLSFGSVLIIIFITLFSPVLIGLLFGEAFSASSKALVILVWSSAATYISISGGNLLVSVKQEKANMYFLILAAILNIVLNGLWIPTMGYKGAALATAIASLVSGGLVLISVENYFRVQKKKNLESLS